jgi:cytochrome c-type biogenesis protein
VDTAATSFVLGLLASASPCLLPLYPGFLAYLSGQTEAGSAVRRQLLGGFVLAGVLSMMLVLGGVIALLSVPIGSTLAIVIPVADGLILLLGVALLLDRNPFRTLPQLRFPILRRPWANAYVYGLLYGPIALPCSGPLVVGIFALSLTVGEAAEKLWVFAWFGLGFGLPLLVISLLSGAFQRRLTVLFARHSHALNRAAGALLVGVAIFDLRQNWTMLVAFYA